MSSQPNIIFSNKSTGIFVVLAALSLLLSACGGKHKQVAVKTPPPPPIQEPAPQVKPKPLPPAPAPKTETKTVEPSKPTVSEEEEETAEEAKTAAAVPPDAKPAIRGNRTGKLVRATISQSPDLEWRSLQHARVHRGTSHFASGHNCPRHQSENRKLRHRPHHRPRPVYQRKNSGSLLRSSQESRCLARRSHNSPLEVLKAPTPLDSGGRWAVQIGGFGEHEPAIEVADHVTKRYHTAKVLCYNSPAGIGGCASA